MSIRGFNNTNTSTFTFQCLSFMPIGTQYGCATKHTGTHGYCIKKKTDGYRKEKFRNKHNMVEK